MIANTEKVAEGGNGICLFICLFVQGAQVMKQQTCAEMATGTV